MPITPEELRERVKPWLQPIAGDAPQGAPASTDPRYEFVRNEAAKLDSPTAATTVQWKSVVDQGGEVLQEKSKDFLIAVYVAYGQYIVGGVGGLTTGLTLLTEMTEQYWPNMFPELKRIRGRVNALTWFVERVAILLPTTKVAASDRAAIEALSVASKRFSQVVRAKFEQNAPAMGPIVENVDRLVMSLPAEAPPPPPPPPPQASPPPQPAAPPPTAAAAPPPPPPPAAPAAAPLAAPTAAVAPANAGDVLNFLREVGTSIASAGTTLRQADGTDPTAYRLTRTGLWLAFLNPPPATGGKTSVPAPPAGLRTQLEKMAANSKWPELLEECESGMQQFRLWLDLQRYAVQALGAMGGTYARAREAVLTEVSSLLRRMPTLPDLQYPDGNGFADAQTKMWIESDVQTAGGGGGGKGAGKQSDPAAEELATALGEARGLMGKGQAADAITVIHAKVVTANSASSRFRARLGLAKLCIQGSQLPVAKALYEGLERDVSSHGLEVWEPGLAAEVLEGYVTCLRSIAKGGKPLPPEAPLMYDRLCRVDPAAAAKIGA